MKTLISKIIPIHELSNDVISQMFTLYHSYYAGTSDTIFKTDLQNKNWIILLYDKQSQLQGFSTLALFRSHYAGVESRVLYSGDTIVAHAFWGQHELAIAWIRFAGKLKAEQPSIPLYWLLIVKGYRTYRYLSAFCHHYYPAPDVAIPHDTQEFMHHLAFAQFGRAYDATGGIVRFTNSQAYLRETWSDIPECNKNQPDVQYFLQRNPHYTRGDELVCLCELAEHNLKPFAKRIFTIATRECI